MVASSTARMSQEVSKIQLVKSDACPPPKFCSISEIVMKGDSMGVLSLIPHKFIMIHDVRICYMCKIRELWDYEIKEAYEKLCNGGILKDEFKIVERKGLTRALEFPRNFKIEWIKVILSIIHDMKYWLQNGPMEITKKIFHRFIGYPTLDKKKTMWCLSQEEIEANTGVEWNGWGLSITNIFYPLIEFVVRVIPQKFYHSRRLNSVPCMTVDQVWKIVTKDHEYDLVKVQRLQLVENL